MAVVCRGCKLIPEDWPLTPFALFAWNGAYTVYLCVCVCVCETVLQYTIPVCMCVCEPVL